MNTENCNFQSSNTIKGIYGDFIITTQDKKEVLLYRLSLISCGLFFSLGLLQWFNNGSSRVWICFLGLAISIGLCLKWIHIYIRSLHQALIIFWTIGCIGLGIVAYHFGLTNFILGIKENPRWLFLVGPLFVSLTGIGFKEFFCFRRIEAIGITLLIPLAFIGRLTELTNENYTFALLVVSSLLLLVLGLRKFDLPPEADIGDKSVFNFLESKRKQNLPKIETG